MVHTTLSTPCKVDGIYVISGHITFAANANGIRGIALRLNGSSYIAMNGVYSTTAGDEISLTVTSVHNMAVNTYVELRAYQSSGAALNINRHSDYSPILEVFRIA